MGQGRLERSDRRITAILCAIMFMSGADMLIMTPILPQVTRELGVDVEHGGFWITAYGGATAIFALLFGPVSDARGRRPVLISGMTVLGLGTLVCGAASSFTALLLARIVAGAGAGMLVTSTTSYVGDHFDSTRRAVVMGWVMGGFFLSLILGIPIGATLTGLFGWQIMFFVFTGMIAVVLLSIFFGLPKPRNEAPHGQIALRPALSAYAGLLRQPQALGILIMSMAIGLSMTMFSVYTSPWMADRFGLDTTERGLVYAIGGPAVLLGGPLAGRLSNSLGRVTVIIAGSLLMAAMQVSISQTATLGWALTAQLEARGWTFSHFGEVPWPSTIPALVVFFMIMIAGSSRSAPFQTLAIEVVAPDKRGALAAVRNSFNQAGSASGAALGSAIWAGSTEHRYTILCVVAASIGLLGVVLMRWLVGPDRPGARAPVERV